MSRVEARKLVEKIVTKERMILIYTMGFVTKEVKNGPIQDIF